MNWQGGRVATQPDLFGSGEVTVGWRWRARVRGHGRFILVVSRAAEGYRWGLRPDGGEVMATGNAHTLTACRAAAAELLEGVSMGDKTGIEWTDATWNPLAGCTPVSEGCRNCYAAREAIRLAGNPHAATAEKYQGTARMTGAGPNRRAVFTGKVNVADRDTITQPLRWKRPRRIFVNAMSDLFHEAVTDHTLDILFAVMAMAPQHTFQVLTKRPERAARYATRPYLPGAVADAARTYLDALHTDFRWPLPNVWMGTSVEDQEAADLRIPHLLRTPAAVRFLSCEPLLGPVDLGWWFTRLDRERVGLSDDPLAASLLQTHMDHGLGDAPTLGGRLHWVITGGESGPGAREFNLAWARSLVRQCRAEGVPVFVKQLGARPAVVEGGWHDPDAPAGTLPVLAPLKDRKGGDPEEWPVDLRVRELPAVNGGG